MNLPIIFGVLTLIFLWYNLIVSIRIIHYLRDNGKTVSLYNSGFFVKGKIFRFLPLYKEVSFTNEGRVGKLYANFYISFLCAIFFLLLGIITVLIN